MTTEIDTALEDAMRSLKGARIQLAAEISQYPTPISGCDAQFNHLLAQRSQVGRAIEALQANVFVPTPRAPTPDAGIESR